jgi:hypothetical protein
MESLEMIKDSLVYMPVLATLLYGTVAALALPLGTAFLYALGRNHEMGLEDGKSAVKFFWKAANNVEVRDMLNICREKMSEEEFDEKYKPLGLEKYFLE